MKYNSVTRLWAFAVITALFIGFQAVRANRLEDRVIAFEHACIPTDTGGGVTQCLQPPVSASLAVRACFRNAGPYMGRTQEDTFHLLAQCFDDYMERDE